LGLQGRTLHNMPENSSFVEDIKGRDLKPGLYVFPDMPTAESEAAAVNGDTPESRREARQRRYEEANLRYKRGPAGILLIVPTGQDMMTGETLGKELATNTIAAWIVAWIVSLMSTDVGFIRRWLAVLLMGVFAWFSLAASYGIWYRFPHDFIHDEF